MIGKLQVSSVGGTVGESSSPELISVTADCYLCLFRPIVTTVACKRHWSFCQKCRLHLNRQTRLAHQSLSDLNRQTRLAHQSLSDLSMLSRHVVGTYQRNKLTWNLSGNSHLHSSQFTYPLWGDPYLKECSWCVQADLQTKKKCRQAMICQTFPRSPCIWGKSHHTESNIYTLFSSRWCCVHQCMIKPSKESITVHNHTDCNTKRCYTDHRCCFGIQYQCHHQNNPGTAQMNTLRAPDQ